MLLGKALNSTLTSEVFASLTAIFPLDFSTYQRLRFEPAIDGHRRMQSEWSLTFALGPLLHWVADDGGALIAIDERLAAYTGCDLPDLLGFGFLAHLNGDDRAIALRHWKVATHTLKPFDYELRIRNGDRQERWHRCSAAPCLDINGKVVFWYGFIEDIDSRKLVEIAQSELSALDEVTHLFTRSSFINALRTALTDAANAKLECCLLRIDLSGFKQFNVTNPHRVGDALLRETARRVRETAPDRALLARLGGGQFAVFFCFEPGTNTTLVAEALCCSLTQPYKIGDYIHFCPADIGAVCGITPRADVEVLYKDADLALEKAKNSTRRIAYFDSGMRADLQVRMSEISVARYSLEKDRIFPYYQPKVDLTSGSVTGFEALLRWRAPDGKTCAPGQILAAMEDPQLAMALDERILERVAGDFAAWNAAGIDPGRIAINVSAAQFAQPDFAKRLLERIAQVGVSPSTLELEITETVFLNRLTDVVIDSLRLLRAAGMTIALDDFGTGYASLIHLVQFPVDVLKIDCSFISGLAEPSNTAIVRMMIELGVGLGLKIVAEGVETDAQAKCLRQLGCGIGQGYLYSPAVSAEKVPDLLKLIPETHRPDDDFRHDKARS